MMEVAESNFRMSTTESGDVLRQRRASGWSCGDDDHVDTVHHCCSAVSFKKNILHRYCEWRVYKC